MDKWLLEHAKVKDASEVAVWNNTMRYMRPCDMAPELQVFLETYIPENAAGRPV